MLKSPGSKNSKKQWLVAIMVVIPIVFIGVYVPFEQVYGVPAGCYLTTETGQCIPIMHPILRANGPLITTA
jgi:hypothetical protein